jgi:tetratricopeptide (TPR) repeat protein
MKCKLVRFLAVSVLTISLVGCSAEAKKAKTLERANGFFKAGEYEKAEIEYLNILQRDGENLVAIEQLAEIWIERGAPVRALPFLQKIRAVTPTNRENLHRLLRITLALGKLDEARKDALALLARVPDDKEALMGLTRAARSAEDFQGLEEALKKANRGTAAFHLATAQLQLRRGDNDGARISLQRARSVEPNSPDVHMAQASYLLTLNQQAEAGKELKAASEAAPVRSLERLRYAEYLAQTGATPDAYKVLEAVTEKAPDYLPGWRGLAHLAITEKKFDQAQGYLEKIFRRDASNYEGRIMRARLLLAKGDSKGAIEELEQVGTQFPALAEDKFVLGQAYLQVGDTARARQALNVAVVQNPHHDAAILLLARVNLAVGDAASVGKAMTQLLRDRPNLLPAQMLLLEAMRALGRLDEVVAVLRKQIEASPERPELHRLLGLMLKEQGKVPEARKSLERSLELTPNFLPIVTELASLDVQAKDFAAAMQRARKQIEHAPEAVGGHLLEAQILAAQGRWDEAEAIALKILKLDAENTAAYELMTHSFMSRSQSPQVAARIDELLAQRPGDIRPVMLAGSVYAHWKQFEKAAATYEKHLEAKPDAAAVLNNLAVLYVENLNQPDRALELAQKARKLEPASAAIADTLGWIHFKRKDYAAALELFKESAVKAPKHGEILYHLGLANEALGHNEAAQTAFRAAAEAPGDFQGKNQIAEKLAALPSAPRSSGAEPVKK